MRAHVEVELEPYIFCTVKCQTTKTLRILTI